MTSRFAVERVILVAGLLTLPCCSSSTNDDVTPEAAPTAEPDTSSEPVCGAFENIPYCDAPIVTWAQQVGVCSDAGTDYVQATGTLELLDDADRCSFPYAPTECEPTFIGVAGEAGVTTFGICAPGALLPLPLGRSVTVSMIEGEYCGLRLTIVDEASELLLAIAAEETLFHPRHRAARRTRLCRGPSDGPGYRRREAVEFSLGEVTHRFESGVAADLDGYRITAGELTSVEFCDGGDDCDPERDVFIIQRLEQSVSDP
jgi:hypothetical protein